MKKQKKIVEIDGEKAIKVTISTVIYAILTLIVFLVCVGSVLAYGTNTQVGNKIATKISKIIPFPAAIVDRSHIVYIDQFNSNADTIQQLYKKQNILNFSTDDGQKKFLIKKREILDKMVEDQIIEILAKEHGISFSTSDVDLAVATKLNEFGTSENVKEDLLNTYGWSMDEFEKKIVLPGMYSQSLSNWVLSQNQGNDNGAKSKIQSAQAALKSGKDFSQVANEFSDGASKSNNGELGWVTKDQVLPELADALFTGKQLFKYEIIESSIGFHIVDIEDKKKNGDSDVLKLRQIFVAKNTFADWLSEQKKKINVYVPMKGFVWNKEAGSIDFSDPQMRVFEKNEREKAQGDDSFLL